MKLIRTEDAVGHVLCHDITQIIPGVVKDAVFRKGHIVTEEDIPVLLSVGKEHLYIWEKNENMLHEDEAAYVLMDIAKGDNLDASEPKEGKIELKAACDGYLSIDTEGLKRVNSLGEMMIATRKGGFTVKKGDKIAGMRIIPLVIEKEKLERAKAAAGEKPLISVIPYGKKTYGLITTGSEVSKKLIEDKFSCVIEKKLSEFCAEMVCHTYPGDDTDKITNDINEMLAKGVDMVICTGGMSVDPDDRTPLAIKNSGVNIISYGSPVLPGAMFLMSYTADGRAVMGLPGCVMYAGRTVFDLVLPKVMSNTPVTADYLSGLGEGGLCLNCKICTFPNCGFGG